MKKIHKKFALLALVAAFASLGLTACKKTDESPSQSGQPTNSETPTKPEHPEHPK